VRTAKLFPGKKQVKAITQTTLRDVKRPESVKKIDSEPAQYMKKSQSTQDLSMILPEKDTDMDRIESVMTPKRVSYSLENLNASHDDDAVFYKPAFEHLSSPKLRNLDAKPSRTSRGSDKSSKTLKNKSPSKSSQSRNEVDSLNRSLQQLKMKYENELEALKARHENYRSPRERNNGELDQSLMQKFYSNYHMAKPQSERSILRSNSSEFSVNRASASSSHVQKLVDRLDTIRVIFYF
jgi:hypothetical protein